MQLIREEANFQPVIIKLESQAEIDALMAILSDVSTCSEREAVDNFDEIPEGRKYAAGSVDLAWKIYDVLGKCL